MTIESLQHGQQIQALIDRLTEIKQTQEVFIGDVVNGDEGDFLFNSVINIVDDEGDTVVNQLKNTIMIKIRDELRDDFVRKVSEEIVSLKKDFEELH